MNIKTELDTDSHYRLKPNEDNIYTIQKKEDMFGDGGCTLWKCIGTAFNAEDARRKINNLSTIIYLDKEGKENV